MYKLFIKGLFLLFLGAFFSLNSCKKEDKNLYLKIENQSDKDITDLFIYTNADVYAARFQEVKGNTTVNRIWFDYGYALRGEGNVEIKAIRNDTVLHAIATYYTNGAIGVSPHWTIVVHEKELSITTPAKSK